MLSRRATYIGIACALLLVIGLFALQFPVFLDAFDRWGWQIKCGSGFGADLDQAVEAGGDFTDQCGTALLLRRLWAVPTVVVGALGLIGLFAASTTAAPRESQSSPS